MAPDDVRSLYLETAEVPEFDVGGLAARLGRAILQVEWYLDGEVTDRDPIDAVVHYAQLEGVTNLDSPLNVGVRQRGEETAQGGPAAVLAKCTDVLERLRTRLPVEPPDRVLSAFGRVLTLDEYLRTRLVEMCVHIEDLSLSLGDKETLPVPSAALADVVEVLTGVAVARHGRPAVIRALTRRERDAVDALRVL